MKSESEPHSKIAESAILEWGHATPNFHYPVSRKSGETWGIPASVEHLSSTEAVVEIPFEATGSA